MSRTRSLAAGATPTGVNDRVLEANDSRAGETVAHARETHLCQALWVRRTFSGGPLRRKTGCGSRVTLGALPERDGRE